uniref:Uncharacterized protein n=1 Tax=Amphimedon queenslandica TaxID=400682 RepID=A0A1X7SSX1_AMPQE
MHYLLLTTCFFFSHFHCINIYQLTDHTEFLSVRVAFKMVS